MSPDDAYDQLSRALDRRPPECHSIARSTEDKLSRADIETLAPACASCDIALLCRQYANTAQVKVGFWAGRNDRATRGRAAKAA